MEKERAAARNEAVWAAVRAHYGQVAEGARAGSSGPQGACCGSGGCGTGTAESAFGAAIYPLDELRELPDGAVLAAQGCGNPTALASLRPGDVVLDLGSGGGIDVILSARRVGPAGKAYGLDMTDEMLHLARENGQRAGVSNVEFLKGHIEEVPLPDASVDVILSNCVVNLSPDKDRVLSEAFRVLRLGGRLAISDVVLRDPGPGEAEIPEEVRTDLALWSGCVGGALQAGEYRTLLVAAGFTDVDVEEVRRYSLADLSGCGGASPEALTEAVAGRFVSAFIRARKPSP